MKKIFHFFFGRTAQIETPAAGPRIQSSHYPDRGGFNSWAENLHRECRQTFLPK